MADKSQASWWVLDFLAVVVALVWLSTSLLAAFDASYQQPIGIHGIMLAVCGSVFGFRIATTRKEPNDNGA